MMVEDRRIEILKGAILLEKRGKTFYESVAKNAESDGVREIFEIMAGEEADHISILLKLRADFLDSGKFSPLALEAKPVDISSKVMSSNVVSKISAVGYEAAAISAAMALEEQAIKFYADGTESAQDSNERKLYQWLADWERTHLDFLSQLDQELRESIWFDQKFWPSI